jgi:hypothetical protein
MMSAIMVCRLLRLLQRAVNTKLYNIGPRQERPARNKNTLAYLAHM